MLRVVWTVDDAIGIIFHIDWRDEALYLCKLLFHCSSVHSGCHCFIVMQAYDVTLLIVTLLINFFTAAKIMVIAVSVLN